MKLTVRGIYGEAENADDSSERKPIANLHLFRACLSPPSPTSAPLGTPPRDRLRSCRTMLWSSTPLRSKVYSASERATSRGCTGDESGDQPEANGAGGCGGFGHLGRRGEDACKEGKSGIGERP